MGAENIGNLLFYHLDDISLKVNYYSTLSKKNFFQVHVTRSISPNTKDTHAYTHTQNIL